jgi:hypothetical protein
MIPRSVRLRLAAFFVLIFIVDWFLYFRHIAHFFQGDTVFLLDHRAHSILGYLKEFVELNASGWYRPLTNELVETILYPFAGLHPVPYRIPVYIAFIAITVGVYLLVLMLIGRHLAAAIATFFFSIHAVNAYTTYDVGFLPELLFTLFFICAVVAYLRYLRDGEKWMYGVSLGCFVGSLLSKEAAMTLPAALFLAHVLFGRETVRQRVRSATRSIVPHVLVLAIYLGFAVGHLHVMGFSVAKLFDTTQRPNPGDYIPVFNRDVFKNADIALTWAFNLPREKFGQPQSFTAGMLIYLKTFRLIVFAALASIAFVGFKRDVLLFGIGWFWITLSPALPLVSHFLPYYLFLPVVGLALIIGAAFTWLHDQLCAFQPVVAAVCIVLLLSGVLYSTSRVIRADIRDNNLLGGSSTMAWNTLNDLKSLYPELPAKASLYFLDAKEQLAWPHDFGGLIKMAYSVDDISAIYQSNGDSLKLDVPNVLVFEVRDKHLNDQTHAYRADPTKFIRYKSSNLEFQISASEVVAGRDQYTVSVPRLSNARIRVAYNIDNGPIEIFPAQLDQEGKVSFNVGNGTKSGIYRFWGFSVFGTDEWIQARRTLMVREGAVAANER